MVQAVLFRIFWAFVAVFIDSFFPYIFNYSHSYLYRNWRDAQLLLCVKISLAEERMMLLFLRVMNVVSTL